MKRISKTIHHGIWLLVAMSVGIGAAVLLTNVGKLAYSYADVLSVRQQNKPVTVEGQEEQVVRQQNIEGYYVVGNPHEPKISARSYIVADIVTGDILAQNGRKVEHPIASVTKMMTAVVAKMLAPENFANGAWLEELPELLAMKRVFRPSVSAATECAALVQTSLLGRK